MMKKFLLFGLTILAMTGLTFGQVNVLDYETVTDPLIEPFDLISYESAVANPDGVGSVGKIVKAGWAFWGGINIYLGGDLDLSGSGDKISVDFYAESTLNDTIRFTLQAFNRYGGVDTYEGSAYYVDVNDTQVGVWKTLEFEIPDDVAGSYNQLVIFFGWQDIGDGEIVYFDNVTVPGFTAYGETEVTVNITDKFNNAQDVKLFLGGTETALTQDGNVYSSTSTLDGYSILVGQSAGIYEVVYAHMAAGVEVRDTVSLVVGNASGAQELTHLIIVEEAEDGTALAISVGDNPPVIDGQVDGVWSNAKTHTLQQRSWWGTPTGLYSSFKIMWDIDNVYLLYEVEDATPYNGNTTAVYENDCMETFFDMNQSATTPFDADDWQIRTIRGLDSWTGSAAVNDTWGADLERAQAEMAEGAGYIIELAIPWTSLSALFLPIVGTEFNYDCSVADVDVGGGARLYRESWTTAEDIAYMNTRDFGTITLSDLESEVSIGAEKKVLENVQLFPNPATDLITIEAESEIAGVRIIDMTGRAVKYASTLSARTASIFVGDLSSGVYLVSITDKEGASSVKKLRVK